MGEPNFIARIPLKSSCVEPIDVLIACPEQDVPFLQSVTSMLNGRHVRPRLASGVDRDVQLFVRAMKMMRGPALVVLVVGRHLGRFQAHELSKAFEEHCGAGQRILVCEVQRGDRVGLSQAIESEVAGLRRALDLDSVSDSIPRLGHSAPISNSKMRWGEVMRCTPLVVPTIDVSMEPKAVLEEVSLPRRSPVKVVNMPTSAQPTPVQVLPRPPVHPVEAPQRSIGVWAASAVIVISTLVLAASGVRIVGEAMASDVDVEQRK